MNLTLKFNTKSRSASIDKAIEIAKLLDWQYSSDPKVIIVNTSQAKGDFAELFRIVNDWKGTELYVNDKLFLNQDLKNITRCILCFGSCPNTYRSYWDEFLLFLDIRPSTIDPGYFLYGHKVFKRLNCPEIAIEETNDKFILDKKALISNYNQVFDLIREFCPIEDSTIKRNLEALPERVDLLKGEKVPPPEKPWEKKLAKKMIGNTNNDNGLLDSIEVTINNDTITALLNSMVSIPSGTFMMGSTDNEDGRAEKHMPVHEVALRGFKIGAYEVTQQQYEAVMGYNPSHFQKANGYPDTKNNPVENVTWEEAMEFCNRLSAITHRTFSLPSEAQWEYACRAGSTTLYSFGDDDALLGKYAWCWQNSNNTHPVGTKLPNFWGLYDMHGNVSEWCLDTDHDSYDCEYGIAPTDGSSWEPVHYFDHVARGGSFIDELPWYFRSAYRESPSKKEYNGLGFRIVEISFGSEPLPRLSTPNERATTHSRHEKVWRSSPACLLLLSKFRNGDHPKGYHYSDDWKTVLGENPDKVINQFIDEKMLEPAGLFELMAYKFKTSDLKTMLKEKGLRVSGNKDDLIHRLIDSDTMSMYEATKNIDIILYKCTDEGLQLADNYLATEKTKRESIEQESYDLLGRAEYSEAIRMVKQYEASQVFPRGTVTNDAEFLSMICSSAPAILQHLEKDKLRQLQLATGMIHLWGWNEFKHWLPDRFDTGIHLDKDSACRMLNNYAYHHHFIKLFKKSGVKTLEITGITDRNTCSECQKIIGKTYNLENVPEIPYAKCNSKRGCFCMVRGQYPNFPWEIDHTS
jgi:formylglycine-generating enzyme required for sulfatase activity